MQNKHNRIIQRTRQRQLQRRKMILIIAASGVACMAIVLTILIQTGNVHDSMAAVSIYTVTEEQPVVEKTLDAPVIKQMPVIGPNTIIVKALKSEHPAGNHSQN